MPKNQKGRQVRAREILERPLPQLITGPHHTTSSALHQLYYQKGLFEWTTFATKVEEFYDQNVKITRPIYYVGRAATSREAIDEFVGVGQESGVQSRFMQSIGTVLGAILDGLQIDIKFACWKAADSKGRPGEPDIALLDRNWQVMSIGEVKAFWVEAHNLNGVDETYLRRLLGQPLRYMRDHQCEYGFLTTYEQTIFLHQTQKNGEWAVKYSEVIFSDTEYAEARNGSELTVSVKQCFIYLAEVASKATPTQNLVPRDDWVDPR